jgi:hypothetical protein
MAILLDPWNKVLGCSQVSDGLYLSGILLREIPSAAPSLDNVLKNLHSDVVLNNPRHRIILSFFFISSPFLLMYELKQQPSTDPKACKALSDFCIHLSVRKLLHIRTIRYQRTNKFQRKKILYFFFI